MIKPVKHYLQGKVVRVRVRVYDVETDADVDPDTLKFSYVPPGLPEVTFDRDAIGTPIVKVATGRYYILIRTRVAAGTWTGAWYSTGVGESSGKWTIEVDPVGVPLAA